VRTLLFLTLLTLGGFATAQSLQQFPQGEFPKTAFDNASVGLEEILSGGPPRDGIPAIDAPSFVSVVEANEWLQETEPVVAFAHDGVARAYPLQILIYHEIVNDEVANLPVTVTFCPLCNASIVFERQVGDTVLDFGTTGRLRNSDLIMYDRQTETWWQQFTGRGIIGEHNGVSLERKPSHIVAFATFKDTYPEGQVLSRDTGISRPYGQNPYRGYDHIDNNPFLYHGELDPRLPAMERVLSIPAGDGNQLVPVTPLSEQPVINITVNETPVVVLAATTANSALDQAVIAESRAIPAAAAYSRTVDGKELTFTYSDGRVLDEQTSSTWNAFGQATDGELAGSALQQIDQGVHFAFAWLAFDPDAEVYVGE